MTNEKFEEILQNCISNIEKVLKNKSVEYSSKSDKLHNFNKAKQIMRCNTKEYALLGMLNKHLVSVIDIILKYEQANILPSKELIDEKIGDSINYLILLKACFLEDIYIENKNKAKNQTEDFVRNFNEDTPSRRRETQQIDDLRNKWGINN